ncbi:hypothetical protein BaRGS_00005363 [Batillaria attramentaria]|uniref:Uncharacterized protein n=1 Tax=Batillaria attramentaria TaxID=370345 RepID=A0ABD0LWV1_9CAEN
MREATLKPHKLISDRPSNAARFLLKREQREKKRKEKSVDKCPHFSKTVFRRSVGCGIGLILYQIAPGAASDPPVSSHPSGILSRSV